MVVCGSQGKRQEWVLVYNKIEFYMKRWNVVYVVNIAMKWMEDR